MVHSYVSRGKKDWDEHLPLISMALHSMKNKTTGFSVNQLMLGREVIQPIDLILGLSEQSPQNPPNWVGTLAQNLSEIHHLARKKIGETQLRQKRDYDLRIFERSYNVGDVVYLRDSSTEIGISSKLRPPWSGPFLVISARPPIYRIGGCKKSKVVHHDRLKPCEDSTFPLWLQRKKHSLLHSLRIDEMEDPVPEPDMVDQQPDDPQDVADSFDPEKTLPYMLGDDPELLEDDNQFDILPFDSQVPFDITSQDLGDLQDSGDDEPSAEHRTTRAGRKIQLPAWFRE